MPSHHHKEHKAERDHDNDDHGKPDSSVTQVAFYDTTPYFRSYFSSVAKDITGGGQHSSGLKLRFKWLESRLTAETVELSAGCPVVCVFVSDTVSADIAQRLYKQGTRMVAIRAAGFNNVDIGACDKLGLTVARVPAYSPYAVAEYATALILSLNRKTHHAYQRVRDYNFSLNRLVGFDMHGKTVGVFGTGKIGQCFVDIMLGFGCRVLCYDVEQAKSLQHRKGVQYMSADDVFAQSDIISLHLPLTSDTKHLISRATLSKMKPHALIINTGRGELVHTEDLLDALRNERIGGAGLDVYEEESEYFYSDLSEYVIKDRLLLEVINQPNCLVTSHQAFLTQEALVAIATTTIDNIKEFIVDGKRMGQLSNSINKKGKDDESVGAAAGGGVKSHATSAGHHGQQITAKL